MRRKRFLKSLAFITVASAGGVAFGSPLADLQILGSTNGGTSYSDSFTGLTPDETILFEVVGELAPDGTSNTSGSGTTLAGTQSSPTDGIGSLGLNLTDSGGGVFSSVSVGSVFSGTGSTAGTTSGSTVTAAHPVSAAGEDVGATSQVVILTGSLTLGSLASTENVSATWNGSGSLKVNTSASGTTTKTLILSNTTESSANPYVGYSSLSLAAQSNPIISMTNSAPTGYGSSQGAVTITGSSGSYVAGVKNFTAASSGYVEVSSFNPNTDKQVYALDIDGADSTQLGEIETDIDAVTGLSGATTTLSNITGSSNNPLASLFTDQTGTPVYFQSNPGLYSEPYIGVNFSNDSLLGGVTLSGIAAVPEPASLTVLSGVVTLGLIRRRRPRTA